MTHNRILSQSVFFCVVIVSLLLVGWQLRPAHQASATPSLTALPSLQGAAAVEHLKQQGLYASLDEAMTATRYGVKPVPEAQRSARGNEYVANNPAQQLRASFAADGLELQSATQPNQAWRLGMKLRSVGYGDQPSKVGSGTLTAQGSRIEYERPVAGEQAGNDHSALRTPHSAIKEWYVNTPSGLEQGFTVAEPPGERRAGEPLRLALALEGELRARAVADGQAVEFVDAAGSEVLRYDHLAVWDARGQKLAARMSVKGKELRLEVEDAEAVYPVTIDPNFTQQAYLKASNTEASDQFGESVAVAGDTVVVGAVAEDSNATGVNGNQADNSAVTSGAAYVFVRSGTTWSQQAYLKASNTGATDQFGISVAVAGDTVVVGARGEASNATGVNGNQADNSAGFSGAAYVFVRSGVTWSQQAYLKASNTGGTDQFGFSVAVAGDTVVVGAWLEDSNATGVNGNQADNSSMDSGAAYVFVRSGVTWSQQAYLKASNTGATDQFGNSVAVAGDTVVVGANAEDSNATGVNGNQADNSATTSGAAYVFVRSGTTWSQQAYLKASNTEGNDQFGFSVAVAGDMVVVGAYLEASNATGVNGNQADNSAGDSGAAYVFVRSGTTWSQSAYLKASNTGVGDQFGFSVAVAGDTVVVGAWLEASNATGVNGNQADNSAANSGAAYVFVRSGTMWSQQAYLKASNTGAFDNFGSSVAVAGDTVVVAAVGEDSNATGVNSNQADNSAANAGAVYVFFTPPIVVNSLADGAPANDGQCTLREALINANNNDQSGSTDCAAGIGVDTITFSLGTGTPSIAVTSALPNITEPITINGNTGGATRIELNGTGAGAGVNGLTITSGNSTIKSLVINRFSQNGIQINTNGGNTIQDCHIGTNAAGTASLANNNNGIFCTSANNVFGGTTASARNVISGNNNDGIELGTGANGNQIQGNYIGTNAAGTGAVGNSLNGVFVNGGANNIIGGTAAGAGNLLSGNGAAGINFGNANGNQVLGNLIGTNAAGSAAIANVIGVSLAASNNNTIGGTTAAARNLISGNATHGVRFEFSSTSNLVQGNFIGTNLSGTAALGNSGDGVNIDSGSSGNTIGGTVAGAGNTIAFNTAHGIQVLGGAGNALLANAIFDNGGLGIELGSDGVTANDVDDSDTGPNNLQNTPILNGTVFGSTTVTFPGFLISTPATNFRIEFFSNPACDTPQTSGEGRVFLGFVNATTNGGGVATYSLTLPVASVTPGHFITATATNLGTLDTSEFSPCLCTYAITPTVQSFPAAGGSGNVAVTAGAGCSWGSGGNPPWITIMPPTGGTGNGTLNYTVAANPGTGPRNGTFFVAGYFITVTQLASGAVVVEDFSAGIPPTWTVVDGGSPGVYMNTSGPLTWTASNPCNRVIPSPFSGTFAIVDASCTMAGATLDEQLRPPPFDATGLGSVYVEFFNQFRWSAAAPNNKGDVDVSTNGGASWTNVLRLENGSDGVPTPNVKSIDITAAIAANPSNVLVRLHYYGQSVAGLRQPLSPDVEEAYWGVDFSIYSYALNATSRSFAANGGMGTVTVATSANVPNPQGQWTATSNAPWLHITSNSPVVGNGMVSYTVDAHTNPTPRNGTITIAGYTFTVRQGAQFNDVPPTHLFYTEIGKLSASGVTQGCGGGNFCPDAHTTREQMAIFIERALGVFTPPPGPMTPTFADVPNSGATDFSYEFIEDFVTRGISTGCAAGPPRLYCPTANVTREQMAIFIIRALGIFTPPSGPAMPTFADVPNSGATDFSYEFVEEFVARGITSGCAAGPPRLYCPTANVTRGQMAVFLVRAFAL